MLHQERNILWPLAQWRNGNRKHVQAVVKIAAKLLFQNHLFQIAVCGSHDAHIHFFGSCAAQPLEFPLLQDAQKLRLQFEGDVANFIEKQRTLVRQFEPPDFLSNSAGEGAALVAKKLDSRANRWE